MQLILEADDVTPGHLVEGGIDNFRITETTGVQDAEAGINVSIFPNPANDFVTITISRPFGKGHVQLFDMAGKAVGNQYSIASGANVIRFPVAAGVYLCEVVVDGKRQIERLSIHY